MTNHASSDFGRRRRLILPPPGKAYWVDSKESCDLAYLSWGVRTFGVNPIPQTLHPGWVYTCITAGSQILETESGRQKLNSGQICRLGPDCPAGWTNFGKRKSSRQITWVWRSPPNEPAICPSSCEVVGTTGDQMEELSLLHRACRREVARPDGFTFDLLSKHRHILDLLFQRFRSGTKNAIAESRLQFALSWLESSPPSDKPLETLRNYLDISASTLERLFKKHLGVSPSVWLHRERMLSAEAMRAKGMRTKEIAYALGYRHPSDLSRARKRWLTSVDRPANQTPEPQERISAPRRPTES